MPLSQAGNQTNVWALLLPLLLLVGFWFIAIRPQRRRQREVSSLQSRLEPGLTVMTGAGLIGTVQSIEDDVIVLEIAPGVQARFVRQAVVRIVEPTTGGPAGQPSDTDDDSSSKDGPGGTSA